MERFVGFGSFFVHTPGFVGFGLVVSFHCLELLLLRIVRVTLIPLERIGFHTPRTEMGRNLTLFSPLS